jgi:antitoxin (DNA-binding transcriptional repressor) of toxin-antitoxin stability system
MDTVDLDYAKAHLEDLAARAAMGETVRIAVPGHGTISLVTDQAAQHVDRRPILGQWKDRLTVPARLLEPLSDDEQAWLSGET